MREGLVSVIVPVHNRPEMLREAVDSALAQTYRPIEIIIVDDESTDETPNVVADLERSHAEVRSVWRENGGPGAARETGRLAATGEFIQYLDSDDLLLPRKLELQVAALRAAPESGVAYGRTKYVDPHGNEIRCTWKNPDRIVDTMLPSFLIERWWETATPLFRESVCDAAGPWLPTRLEEDWEYDCRVGALGTRLAYVPEYVAVHRHHEGARLSAGPALDPERLRDRAVAHQVILMHAQNAAIPAESTEMRHFARGLFLLARQCGSRGLVDESKELFRLAREASGSDANRLQFRLYASLARLVGWRTVGRLSAAADRIRTASQSRP